MVQVHTDRLRENISARRALAERNLREYVARDAAQRAVNASPDTAVSAAVDFNPSRVKLNQILAELRGREQADPALAFNAQPQLAMSFAPAPVTPAGPPRPRTLVHS